MRSTIIAKKKTCITCGNKDYIFSKGECKRCSTIRSTNKRYEAYEDEVESESRNNLVDDLDAVTSLIVRHQAANAEGVIECFTCDKKITIAESQCSHFIPRQHLSTRWFLMNLKAACKECNEYKSGNLVEYEKRLTKEVADFLRELSREISKPTITELKQLLTQYRNKLELIKRRK